MPHPPTKLPLTLRYALCLATLLALAIPAHVPARYGMAAPLMDLSLGTPVVDGQRDPLLYDRAWRSTRILYRPSAEEDPVRVLAMATPTDLYMLIEDMPIGVGGQPRSISFAFDVNHDGGRVPQTDDLLFMITEAGVATVARGNAVNGWASAPSVTGWEASAGPSSSGSEFRWNVELRIPLSLLQPPGHWSSRAWAVGFQASHNNLRSSGDMFAWPPSSQIIVPDTWGDLLLIRPPRPSNQRPQLDVARITQGAEFDIMNRTAYDMIAGKKTTVMVQLWYPYPQTVYGLEFQVQRTFPSPGPVRTIADGEVFSLWRAPRGRFDRSHTRQATLPGSFFDQPGTYRFSVVPFGLGGRRGQPIGLGTRVYQPTNDFNVLLQPGNLEGVVDDGRPWGDDLNAQVVTVMDHLARLFPVRDGAAPFRFDPAAGQAQTGIRYLLVPFAIQPRDGDDLDSYGPRHIGAANDALLRLNARLERDDPGNVLGRIDRGGALGASTGTGGGQAQFWWNPCMMGLGFDANPVGFTATVLIHEFMHCLGREHTPFDRLITLPNRPAMNTDTGEEVAASHRTVMFWLVSPILASFPEATTWNALRQTLVDKPRLPTCPDCGPGKDAAAFLPLSDSEDMFRISGTVDEGGTLQISYTEVVDAEGHDASRPDIFGEYDVAFYDANGDWICSFPFSVDFAQSDNEDMICEACGGSHGSPPEEPATPAPAVSFLHQIPLCDGSIHVAVRHLGTTLWESPLPSSTPQVSNVVASILGDGSVRVQWDASDGSVPAGDLRHAILFRQSPGALPVLIETGLTERDVTLSPDLAPASPQARFIIQTSNGRNVGEGTSNPVNIAPRPPAVVIVSPTYDDFDFINGSVIQGVPHRFVASAWDATDGPLDGDSVVWEDGSDGTILGTGANTLINFPDAGGYAIKAVATNSAGLSSEAWLQFGVNADTDGDGLPDIYELQHACLNMQLADSDVDHDDDGLTSLDEFYRGTDPCNPDTNGNGITDGDIVSLGGDPLDGQLMPDPSAIFVAPSLMRAALPAGEDTSQQRTLTVRTIGDKPVPWYVMTDTPWIGLLDEEGFGDGSVRIVLDPELMEPGANTGLVVVASDSGPPRLVQVEVELFMDQDAWIVN